MPMAPDSLSSDDPWMHADPYRMGRTVHRLDWLDGTNARIDRQFTNGLSRVLLRAEGMGECHQAMVTLA